MKYSTSLAAALLFSLTLLFFGPSCLYWTNIDYFPYFYSQLLLYIICASVAVGCLFTIIVLLLKDTVHQKAVSCVFALGFLLWIQGNILLWNYGVLDGTDIIWSDYFYKGLLDSAIWVIVLSFCFFKSSLIYGHIRTVCVLLLVVQAISLGITAKNAPPQSSSKYYTVCEDNKFDFSKGRNIIVLVLDQFRSDIFQEIIHEDSRYADIFDGFTFFRNSISGYPFTHLSIPLMLTGQYYNNSVPFEEWKESVYTNSSIPVMLRREGYRADIFTFAPISMYFNEQIADNFVRSKSFKSIGGEVGFIFDLTLFRHSPSFGKQILYNKQKWILQRVFLRLSKLFLYKPPPTQEGTQSIAFSPEALQHSPELRFIDDMLKRANSNNSKPSFKFYHLNIPHAPFILNENLEYVNMGSSRQNIKTYSKAALKITELFLARLKQMNIYDNSMIFVVSDHGRRGDIQLEGMPGDLAGMVSGLKLLALNLFLVKPLNARSELNISDAPVASADMPKTIAEELQLHNSFSGMSVFDMEETAVRNRSFFYCHAVDIKPPFWGNFLEYNISGLAWLEKSWNETNRIFTSDGIIDYSPSVHEDKKEIVFGKSGNATSYQGFGFGETDETHTKTSMWLPYNLCHLMIPYKQCSFPLVVKLRAAPFLADGKITQQRANIEVNMDTFLGGWVFDKDGDQEKKKIIDHKLLKGNVLHIRFWFPDAQSPQNLGLSDDGRLTALAFNKLVIESAKNVYDYGETILFGIQDDSVAQDGIMYQQRGWSTPAPGFTWTEGKDASLVIPVKKTASDLILRVEICAYLGGGKVKQQRAIINVNGEKTGEWTITREGFHVQETIIPNQLFKDSVLRIRFELPDAVSPKELGTGEDARTLGLGFRKLYVFETS